LPASVDSALLFHRGRAAPTQEAQRTVLTAERVTAVGKVVDANGNAIEHATILVNSADVKKGFSLFCPTCYVDCGKRTFTGPDGTYSIPGLNSDLVFDLLVAREGYNATFVKRVNPGKGSLETAVLKKPGRQLIVPRARPMIATPSLSPDRFAMSGIRSTCPIFF
jgi:hypothetical protein